MSYMKKQRLPLQVKDVSDISAASWDTIFKASVRTDCVVWRLANNAFQASPVTSLCTVPGQMCLHKRSCYLVYCSRSRIMSLASHPAYGCAQSSLMARLLENKPGLVCPLCMLVQCADLLSRMSFSQLTFFRALFEMALQDNRGKFRGEIFRNRVDAALFLL